MKLAAGMAIASRFGGKTLDSQEAGESDSDASKGFRDDPGVLSSESDY